MCSAERRGISERGVGFYGQVSKGERDGDGVGEKEEEGEKQGELRAGEFVQRAAVHCEYGCASTQYESDRLPDVRGGEEGVRRRMVSEAKDRIAQKSKKRLSIF